MSRAFSTVSPFRDIASLECRHATGISGLLTDGSHRQFRMCLCFPAPRRAPAPNSPPHLRFPASVTRGLTCRFTDNHQPVSFTIRHFTAYASFAYGDYSAGSRSFINVSFGLPGLAILVLYVFLVQQAPRRRPHARPLQDFPLRPTPTTCPLDNPNASGRERAGRAIPIHVFRRSFVTAVLRNLRRCAQRCGHCGRKPAETPLSDADTARRSATTPRRAAHLCGSRRSVPASRPRTPSFPPRARTACSVRRHCGPMRSSASAPAAPARQKRLRISSASAAAPAHRRRQEGGPRVPRPVPVLRAAFGPMCSSASAPQRQRASSASAPDQRCGSRTDARCFGTCRPSPRRRRARIPGVRVPVHAVQGAAQVEGRVEEAREVPTRGP